MLIFKKYLFLFLTALSVIFYFTSCTSIDLFEKVEVIPQHKWKTSYKPAFEFAIKDTTADYQLFIILRHNDRYGYNNIWLNLWAKAPNDSTQQKFALELPLATNEKGWLASGMDDLYEHRIPVLLDPEKFNFKKSGHYTFIIENIMREDPLPHVMNVGLRLEKKTR